MLLDSISNNATYPAEPKGMMSSLRNGLRGSGLRQENGEKRSNSTAPLIASRARSAASHVLFHREVIEPQQIVLGLRREAERCSVSPN